ncbi:MAG: PHB depolymerase family esterase [Actinomycetota bacterium]
MTRKTSALGLVLLFAAVTVGAAACAGVRDGEEVAQVPGDAQDIAGSLRYAGQERTYLLHLPPAYDGEDALPLLFVFHGGGGDGEGMVRLTHFSDIADEHGFIAAYPDGIDKNWNDGRPEVNPGVDDVGFISALIDELVDTYGIDTTRVYSTGISNGGMFSYRLACELSDKIAAIAPVAALMGEDLSRRCSPSRPVPVMLVVGTDDPLVPWEGGEIGGDLASRGYAISAAATVSFWVGVDGCTGSPDSEYLPDAAPGDGTMVRREIYGGGRDGTEVVLLAVEGGGHTWPGGWQYMRERTIGLTCRDIDAGEVIWDFFTRFTLSAQ